MAGENLLTLRDEWNKAENDLCKAKDQYQTACNEFATSISKFKVGDFIESTVFGMVERMQIDSITG